MLVASSSWVIGTRAQIHRINSNTVKARASWMTMVGRVSEAWSTCCPADTKCDCARRILKRHALASIGWTCIHYTLHSILVYKRIRRVTVDYYPSKHYKIELRLLGTPITSKWAGIKGPPCPVAVTGHTFNVPDHQRDKFRRYRKKLHLENPSPRVVLPPPTSTEIHIKNMPDSLVDNKRVVNDS